MSIFRPRTHDVVTMPPVPPRREVHLSIWAGSSLAGASVERATLQPEPVPGMVLVGQITPENRYSFALPSNVPYTWGAVLEIDADGFELFRERVILAPDLDVNLRAVPRIQPTQGLVIDGQFFRTTDGQPYTIIGCTDFRLLDRVLRGEDIGPILTQRREVGFNDVRVLLTCAQMFMLNPAYYGAAYDVALQSLCRQTTAAGLTAELVVFADATRVIPGLEAQREFLQRITGLVQDWPGMRLELVNENDQPINRIDAGQFARPIAVLASHGSNGSRFSLETVQPWPVRPAWSYETMHYNNAPEWWRSTGHESMEVSNDSHRPCVANENTRFPDRSEDPRRAYDAAAGAALLCAGSVFHSVRGKSSELWDGVELACAQAWTAGARTVPLRFQRGQYLHRTDLEGPGVLRAYERRLTDGTGCIVSLRT